MFSHISLILIIFNFSLSYCRTSLEETVEVDFDEKDKSDLQVEIYDNDLYNVVFTLNNETFDFNITKKYLDVDVWIADEEGETTKTDYQV